jgi:hypothetical protein
MSGSTQLARIRRALEAGERITPMDALRRWGCFRLGARVYDLRCEGFDILTSMVDRGDGTQFAEYRLISRPGEKV